MSLEKLSNDAQAYVDTARRFILDRLPEDRNSRIYLAAGSLSVAGVVLYPLVHYAILGRQLTHTFPNASSRYASLDCGEISTLSKDLVESPRQYRIVHDKVSKPMPQLTIGMGEDARADFTKMLRYNMSLLSKTPQSWIGWFALKDQQQKETFTTEHIESLQFEEGDLVNGLYEVVKRTPLRVEFAVRPPPGYPGLYGLLVIQLRPRNQGAVLQTETIQWAKRDAGISLPLESWLIRFLHDWTTRWTATKAAKYLQSITR